MSKQYVLWIGINKSMPKILDREITKIVTPCSFENIAPAVKIVETAVKKTLWNWFFETDALV